MPESERLDDHVEPYRFDCARCGHGWTVAYQVRDLTGPEGDEVELYLLNGVPVPSPRVGVTCPTCGYDPVRGWPAGEAPERPAAPAPGRVRAVAGVPLTVFGVERLDVGRTRVRLGLGRTRLELVHGPGPLPDHVRQELASPVPVVAGVDGLFDAGHWAEPRSRVVWERHGRWFMLIGLAEREVLVQLAGTLADDLPALLGPG
jgi:hypothetical protein